MKIHFRFLYYQNNKNYVGIIAFDDYVMTGDGNMVQLICDHGFKL